jgi:membrane protease YdiL (CAAX protease family)
VIRLGYHLYQGPFGVVAIVPLGLILAYWYAKNGKLWPLIVAHAAIDLVGLLTKVQY